MTQITAPELARIEAQARALRAEATRDALRALRTWIAARLGGGRTTQTGAQHG